MPGTKLGIEGGCSEGGEKGGGKGEVPLPRSTAPLPRSTAPLPRSTAPLPRSTAPSSADGAGLAAKEMVSKLPVSSV